MEQHHNYTGGLLLLYTLLILLGAIFFTVAQVRVTQIQEYKNGNAKLNTAKNYLIAAYVLGYIAAGMGLVLAIIYFGHVAWGIQNEWPHLLIFILLFLLVIISGILGFVALRNISDSQAANKNGTEGWIWAAEVVGLLALIILIISGAWRAQYLSTRGKVAVTTVSTQHEATFHVPDTTTYEPAPQVFAGGYTSPPIPAPGAYTTSVPVPVSVSLNQAPAYPAPMTSSVPNYPAPTY